LQKVTGLVQTGPERFGFWVTLHHVFGVHLFLGCDLIKRKKKALINIVPSSPFPKISQILSYIERAQLSICTAG